MPEILIECNQCGIAQSGDQFTSSYLICKSCIRKIHGEEALEKAIQEDKKIYSYDPYTENEELSGVRFMGEELNEQNEENIEREEQNTPKENENGE